MATLLTVSYERRTPITPPRRNPITQTDVQTPEPKRPKKSSVRAMASPIKAEGIALGAFSEQGRRSFSLAYADPEPYMFSKKMCSPGETEPTRHSTLRKKAEFEPVFRNPIIQEEVQITPPKVRGKITKSSIFKSDSRPIMTSCERQANGL